MFTIKKLTQKEKELIAVAASIASGCPSSTTHHIKLARKAGATDGEVLRSIYIALDMRDNATEILAEAAQGNQINEYPAKLQSGSREQTIDDLMSIGAALACNSVAGLKYYLTEAKAVDTPKRQIQTAAGIARAIRKEAEEKADAIIGNPIEPTPVGADDQLRSCYQQADCGLSNHTKENVTAITDEEESNPTPHG